MFSLFCLVFDFPYLLIFFFFWFSDKSDLRFIDLSILEFMYCQFYLYSLFQSSRWTLNHTYQFAWDILVFAYCPNTISNNTLSFQKCTRKVKVAQSCLTLYGILQVRILEWVALSSLCVSVCVLNKSDYCRNLTIVLVGRLHMIWIGAPARAGQVGQKRLGRGQLDASLRAARRCWEPGCRWGLYSWAPSSWPSQCYHLLLWRISCVIYLREWQQRII